MSPISGAVPLTVSINAVVNTASVCGGSLYNIDYGDGSIQSQISVPAGNCQQVMKSLSHTYRKVGNYNATISVGQHRASVGVSAYAGGASAIPSQQAAAAAQNSDSIMATPSAGLSPLAVVFTGLINIQQSCGGGMYTLVFGDGNTAGLSFDATTCSARTFSIAHEFSDPGRYTTELHLGAATGPVVNTVAVTAY